MAEKATQLRLGPFKASFPKLFVPEAFEEGGKLMYSVNVLIPNSKTKTIAIIEKAIEAAKKLGVEKKAKWKGKVPANLKLHCWVPGEEKRSDDSAYQGVMVLTAKSDTKPICILKDGSPATQDDIYSGCIIYVSVNFAPYDTGSNGVTCYLGNVMKFEDDDRLDGRKSAEQDFGDLLEDTEEGNGEDDEDDEDDPDLGF